MGFERLPYGVKPLHYEIAIKTNFETFVFDGEVAIEAEVVENVNQIKINSADLRNRWFFLFYFIFIFVRHFITIIEKIKK